MDSLEPHQRARLSVSVSKSRGSQAGPSPWDLHELGAQEIIKPVRRHSHSSVRRHSPDFSYINYDPEQDVEKAREMARKQKSLSLLSLFRYTTWLEIIVMVFGAVVSILSAVLVPWIFYWCGKLLVVLLLDFRCLKGTWLAAEEMHSKFLSSVAFEFLINISYAAVAFFICNYISWRCFAWPADLQAKRLSVTYFESVIRKDMAWFDNYVDRDFSHLMTEEITQIRAGIGEKVPALLHEISVEICIIILTFMLNYKIGILLCVCAPVIYIVAFFASYAASRQEKEAAKAYVQAGDLAEETLSNIKMIKIYEGEATEVSRFVKYMSSMSKKELKWIFLASLCSALVWFGLYCIFSLALWISTSAVHMGSDFCQQLDIQYKISQKQTYFIGLELTFPEGPQSCVMVLMAVVFISAHTMDIPYYIKEILEAKRLAAEVFFLIDWKPRIDNLSEDGKLPNSSTIGRIEAHNVGFKYPSKPTEWIIRNVRLTIFPSQIVGLVGRERSGKSTLLKLILRLYDTCEGQITLDGANIQSYNIRWLRSQVSLITQDTIVFPVSIEENLRFVKTNASMSEIHNACRNADIHSRIMDLPNGYQTVMTEGHRTEILTPKEMRKIAIARALLLKPRILLIDDPLISSDDEFEGILIKMIRLLHLQSTMIVTASRANSLMKSCDHIYYFENGKVVEGGTHSQLLKDKGAYYKMIEETLDVVFESRPKFTSQLTAYKFAKSLRKMKEHKQSYRHRGSKVAKTDSIGKLLNMFHHSHGQQDPHQYLQDHQEFGVGGFQKYSFAKSSSFNPERIGNFLRNINAKRSKRNVTVKKSRSRRLRVSKHKPNRNHLTIEIDEEDADEQENIPHDQSLLSSSYSRKDHVKISDVGSGGVHLSPSHHNSSFIVKEGSISGKSQFNTDYNLDNVSICSEDSEEFWDDYYNKLETLKHIHESGSWGDILSLVKGDRIWIALGCLSSMFLGMGRPCFGLLIGFMCLNFIEPNEVLFRDKFMKLCLAFIIIGLITGISAFCQVMFNVSLPFTFEEMLFSFAGKKISVRIRKSLFASMLKQDLVWFDHTENDISVLCSRLASDTDCVQHVLLTSYGVIFQHGTTIIVSTILAFALFPTCFKITLGVLVASVAMIILGYFTGILNYNQIAMMDAELEHSSQLSYQTISSIRSCIILGLEKYFLIQFKQSLVKPFRHFYIVSELRCIFAGMSMGFPWLILAIFVYYSFKYAITEDSHPNIKYIFIVIELMIFGLREIGEVISLLTKPSIGKAAAHRIWKILLSESQMNFSTRVIRYDKNPRPPRIQLIDIHFKYSDKEILNGINMDILPSTLVAIVGASESGKTSLTNIILRLADATSGTLLFDGEDVRNINVTSIRKIMAFVQQDSGIINDMTVAENIRFGNNDTDISEEEIIQAAKAAKVHFEILDMKHGYDTKVDSLTTGIFTYAFKQRLALARALINNPKILIVDDATSSIDSEHDIMIRNSIQNATDGRTVIIISQKIEPIRHADFIYVMDGGSVIESGNDSSLLDLQGFYYEMYMTQRLVDAAAELQPDKKTSLEDSEKIEMLKRQAQNAKTSRKSSLAYTKFLSVEMERMREHLKNKDKKMKDEQRKADLEEPKLLIITDPEDYPNAK